jgi:hypothetical protein
LDRRRFVAGATGLAAASTLSPLLAAAPAWAEAKFRLFDAMRFVGKPDNLVACGLTPIRVVYAYEFWPNRNWDEPDLDHVETQLVPKLLGEGT